MIKTRQTFHNNSEKRNKLEGNFNAIIQLNSKFVKYYIAKQVFLLNKMREIISIRNGAGFLHCVRKKHIFYFAQICFLKYLWFFDLSGFFD